MREKPDLDKERYILDRKGFRRMQGVLWVIAAAWLAVFVIVVKFYDSIDGWIFAAMASLLVVTAPALKELFQSYKSYRNEEEGFRKKR